MHLTVERPALAAALKLTLTPVSRAEANAYVSAVHRHHKPTVGDKYRIGVADGDELVGVIIVGRPVARHYDDGLTLEVTRCAVHPTARNASSLLYGAAWRAAKALGYRRLISYTRADESGASLRGAGWRVVAERAPRKGWDTPARRRLDDSTEHGVARLLWEATAPGAGLRAAGVVS